MSADKNNPFTEGLKARFLLLQLSVINIKLERYASAYSLFLASRNTSSFLQSGKKTKGELWKICTSPDREENESICPAFSKSSYHKGNFEGFFFFFHV